jgi:hypothetical protein
VPGFYRVRATLDINGTFTVGQYIGVKVGNITTGDVYYNFWKAQGSVTGDYPVSVTGTVYAKAGDILGVDSISSGSSLSYSASLSNSDFSYDLCQGPQAIAASEKITAIYKTSAGQALGAGVVLIDFGTLEEDSHNCVTTGAAWKFTAKTNRIYKVSGALRIDTAGRRVDLYKNGSYYRTLFEPSGASETVSFHTGLRLNSGDYIDIRAQSGSAAAVYADDKFNYVLVEAN